MSFRNSPPRGPAEPPAHRTPRLTVPREQLAEELSQRVGVGRQLRHNIGGNESDLRARRHDYYTWTEYNEALLRRSFDQAGPADEYSRVGPVFVSGDPVLHEQWGELDEDIEDHIRRLVSLAERLPLFDTSEDSSDRPTSSRTASTETPARGDVFIVHGHDGNTKVVVARFLAQLTGREPVILHEQPDGGGTLIEKLEHNAARAGAAVVLLTADDVGGTRSGFGKEGTDPGPQHPRARQNVVFEHGYFLAALGRKHVVMLYEPAVELPSDLSGLAYTPLDAGGAWKNLLARELKYMGYDVDLDVLLRG